MGQADIKTFNTSPPKYGVDYAKGWIGFNHAGSWFSAGIAHVQRWKKVSDITVSHVFIVSGEDECIEAAYPKGVVRSKLSEAYWSKDDRYVIFRRPKNLTSEIADRIVDTAEAEIGREFDFATTANLAVQKNFIGWIANTLTQDEMNRTVDWLIEDDNAWLCSALGAYCLKSQPEYDGMGVLKNRPGMLTPQELFEADELFDPVAREDGGTTYVGSEKQVS